jgi:hypothetical protein
VSTKLAAGDYAGAVASSNRAKTFCIVSAVISAVIVVIAIAISATTTTTTYFP